VGRYFTGKKNEVIKKYLYESTICIQEQYKSINMKNDNIEENSNIWFFWWQGIETAPEMIRLCYESIQRNAGNHSVVLINKENYMQYVDLPESFFAKFKAGKMCHANFADVIRVALLAKYGGIWLDATIYVGKPFSSEIYKVAFCSNKRKNQKTSLLYPAQCRWGTYYLASGKNNIIMNYTKDVFLKFWEKHNMVIDYGMIDYIIALGYDTNEQIAKLIDDAPFSNEHIHILLPMLNKPYNEEIFSNISGNTNLFKLSYKLKFEQSIDGKETLYGHLCKKYMEKME
jgi:hypothetical protein